MHWLATVQLLSHGVNQSAALQGPLQQRVHVSQWQGTVAAKTHQLAMTANMNQPQLVPGHMHSCTKIVADQQT